MRLHSFEKREEGGQLRSKCVWGWVGVGVGVGDGGLTYIETWISFVLVKETPNNVLSEFAFQQID